MAEFQSPEGLLAAITKIVSEKWGPCTDYICEADRSGDGSECTATRSTVADVLAALFDACEVREESRIVIDSPEVTGSWLPAALAGHDQRLAANWPSGRVERRFVIETKPEPVVPDNSEKEEPDGRNH